MKKQSKKDASKASKTNHNVIPLTIETPQNEADLSGGAAVRYFEVSEHVVLTHKLTAANNDCVLTQKGIINGGRQLIQGKTVSTVEVKCPNEFVSLFPDLCLTQYDLIIVNAVCTLIRNAQEHKLPLLMTTKMIHGAMPGISTDPTQAQLKRINDTMWKLRHLEIIYTADPREIEPENEYGELQPAVFSDTLLSYRVINEDNGLLQGIDQYGNAVKYYDFEDRIPVLYKIAKQADKVAYLPTEYIRVDIRMDETHLLCVRYILQRVHRIVEANNRTGINTDRGGNLITPEAILGFLHKMNASDDAKHRIRSFAIKPFLEHLKMCGWLKDYQLLDKKKKVIPKRRARGRKLAYYGIIPVGGLNKYNGCRQK